MLSHSYRLPFPSGGQAESKNKTIKMIPIKNLSAINSNTQEGRYLLAAMAKITTESQTDKTPDEVLQQIYDLQEHMFKDSFAIPQQEEKPNFKKALERLLNSYSMEKAGGNTPDFILAEYLTGCLTAYGKAVNSRDNHNK